MTLRSTYLVQNETLYPLELILVDANNKPMQSLQKIGGTVTIKYCIDLSSLSLQLLARNIPSLLTQSPKTASKCAQMASYFHRSLLGTRSHHACTGGFGYNWCSDSIRWEELIRNPAQTISCRSKNGSEAPFRFQAFAQYDPHDPTTRKYPKITLQLRAPIELENLLPYDISYRVFDKNTNQNWTSFLRHGGVMPIHSVQLDHLVLLNITLQDAGE